MIPVHEFDIKEKQEMEEFLKYICNQYAREAMFMSNVFKHFMSIGKVVKPKNIEVRDISLFVKNEIKFDCDWIDYKLFIQDFSQMNYGMYQIYLYRQDGTAIKENVARCLKEMDLYVKGFFKFIHHICYIVEDGATAKEAMEFLNHSYFTKLERKKEFWLRFPFFCDTKEVEQWSFFSSLHFMQPWIQFHMGVVNEILKPYLEYVKYLNNTETA